MLVERRGQLVTRADIVDRLWGKDVFVDVETGVHTAVRKIRQALRDSPEQPVFIDTVSGKGYRFVAPVEVVSEEPAASPSPAPPEPPLVAIDPPAAPVAAPARARIGLALLAVAAVAGIVAWGVVGRGGRRLPCGSPCCRSRTSAATRIATTWRTVLLRKRSRRWGRSIPNGSASSAARRSWRTGDGEIPGRDRARAWCRLSCRELHSRRKRPAPHHGQAHSGRGSGPGVVADVQPRAHQHARVPAGTQRGDRRTDSVQVVAGAGRRADTTRTEKRRRLRLVSARPQLRQPAHAGDDRESDRALPTCNAAGPGLCARLVRARGCLCGKRGQ